jgi:hypothetical protein
MILQVFLLTSNSSSKENLLIKQSIDKTIFDINQLLDEMILNDFTFVNNKLKVDDSHINYISYVNFIYNTFISKYFTNKYLQLDTNKENQINEIKNKFMVWIEIFNTE